MDGMRRRQLLGLGAVGLGAVALESCVALPWARPPSISGGGDPEELDRILQQLDATVAKLRSSKPDPASSHPNAAEGHKTITTALATMCLVGTYRDLPEGAKHEPRIERRLAEALPEIHHATVAARNYLTEMSGELRTRIDKALLGDPELPMRVMERIDEQAKQYGVPLEQRTYLRTSTAQLAWRFRTQGTAAVTSELTTKYDRSVARKTAELGMPIGGEEELHLSGGETARAKFRSHASLADIRRATCSLAPHAVIDGRNRPIDLQWRAPDGEFRCPQPVEPDAIQGDVVVEVDPAGLIVTVELFPPPDGTAAGLEELNEAKQNIVLELRRRTERSPSRSKRLGMRGESCRSNGDCEEKCISGTCVPMTEGMKLTTSAKVLRDTAKVAKVGAYLLIPPICFVGILVLLGCMFVAIVAGFMAAGGN